MDVRTRKLERMKGPRQRPVSVAQRVMRSRITARANTRPARPLKPVRKQVVIPNFSREIESMRREMALLDVALYHRKEKVESHDREQRERLARITKQVDAVAEEFSVKKANLNAIHQQTIEREQELAEILDEIKNQIQNMRLLEREHGALLQQIARTQKELSLLVESKDRTDKERTSSHLTERQHRKTIEKLDGEIEKKTQEVVALAGEMQNFRQRMRDLRTYEKRIASYYQSVGIQFKI